MRVAANLSQPEEFPDPVLDALAVGRSFSIELYPPRNATDQDRLQDFLEVMAGTGVTFASVTYGAAGSARDHTRNLVSGLLDSPEWLPMAHLTCTGHTRAELVELLASYRMAGLRHLLTLLGDPPLDGDGIRQPGELDHAIDLLRLARSVGEFTVAVALHPDVHPEASDAQSDFGYQAEKLAEADLGLTQFFFEMRSYERLIDEMDRRGVRRPIVPGLMPIQSRAGLEKMSAMSGAQVPEWVRSRLDRAAAPGDVARIGVEIACELGAELLAGGVPGLHLYTMNRADPTRAIWSGLGLNG